jgi:hypothetical protein
MRRSLVTALITSCTVALALPAGLGAQTPPAQAAPAPEKQAEKKEPRMAFAGDAGVFLYQIKPDQTAVFEELFAKVKDSLGKSEKPERKQQLAGWKLYKATEPGAGGSTLYVFIADPAVKGAEYDLLMLLAESLGAAAGTIENQELFKKYVSAFASGANRLNLTPVGGM